jgi:STE24 endopeptidase
MTWIPNWFFWVFVVLYLIHLTLELVLDVVNLKEMDGHADDVPELFSQIFSKEQYQKSIEYTRAKTHFGWVKTGYDVLILWALILSGAFYTLYAWLGNFLPPNSLWHLVAYPFLLGGIFYLFHLPFGIYHQFVLEDRFGFNRTTVKTFILDQIKTLLISVVLGVPLIALLFSLVSWLGDIWWLAGWGVMMGFQFLTAAIFPVILAPLFYKFIPLQEGELKEQLIALAKKIKFKMAGIFTIDGSRRSTHSNAFFAGLGKTRRIVLFDTLVEKLSTPEIVAVLGHEMGHNVKKHIQKSLLLSAAASLVGFYLLSLCLKWPTFFQAFGVPVPNLAVGFVLFSLLSAVFTFPFNPIFKWISRHNEYESDAFSVEVTGEKDAMKNSLIKLSRDNLSNLTPHPWYSFYHYSHPTTAERVAAIEALVKS